MERDRARLASLFAMALSVWFVLSVCGCQATLTKAKRAGINSVSVDVSMPDRMSYGPRQGPSTLLGVVAHELSGYAASRKTLSDVMRENDIDAGGILVAHFKEQLEAKKIFPPAVETDADASFRFRIHKYGLQTADDLPSWPPYPHKAVLDVTVELRRRDGTLVWRNFASNIWGPSKVEAYKDDEYFENPDLLRKGFEQAAGEIVRDLFKNVRE